MSDLQDAVAQEALPEMSEKIDTPENQAATAAPKAKQPTDARDAIAEKYRKSQAEKRTSTSDETPAKPDKVAVKINGVEKLVPADKIEAAGGVEAYQKQAAAAEMLRQAAEDKARIRQQEAGLQAREAALEREAARLQALQVVQQQAQTQPATQPAPQPAPSQATNDEARRRLNEELKQLIADEHEAALDDDYATVAELRIKASEKLAQLAAINRPAAAQTIPAHVLESIEHRIQERTVQTVDARLRREQYEHQYEAQRQAGEQYFDDHYPMLAKNPSLRDLVNRKTIEIREKNPRANPAQIIKQAADETLAFVREISGADGTNATRGQPSASSEKMRMNAPRPAGARAAGKPEVRPPTRSEIVQQMRQRRGQ